VNRLAARRGRKRTTCGGVCMNELIRRKRKDAADGNGIPPHQRSDGAGVSADRAG
jgi:hypothetical protein